jgi:hypothetical protein
VRVNLRCTETETFALCASEGRVHKDRAIRETGGASAIKGPAIVHEAIGRPEVGYRVARYYAMMRCQGENLPIYFSGRRTPSTRRETDGSSSCAAVSIHQTVPPSARLRARSRLGPWQQRGRRAEPPSTPLVRASQARYRTRPVPGAGTSAWYATGLIPGRAHVARNRVSDGGERGTRVGSSK